MRPEKSAALSGFLNWALTDGQKSEAALHYAPLPQALSQGLLGMLNPVLGPPAEAVKPPAE